jgi:hypothetical protein
MLNTRPSAKIPSITIRPVINIVRSIWPFSITGNVNNTIAQTSVFQP